MYKRNTWLVVYKPNNLHPQRLFLDLEKDSQTPENRPSSDTWMSQPHVSMYGSILITSTRQFDVACDYGALQKVYVLSPNTLYHYQVS